MLRSDLAMLEARRARRADDGPLAAMALWDDRAVPAQA